MKFPGAVPMQIVEKFLLESKLPNLSDSHQTHILCQFDHADDDTNLCFEVERQITELSQVEVWHFCEKLTSFAPSNLSSAASLHATALDMHSKHTSC